MADEPRELHPFSVFDNKAQSMFGSTTPVLTDMVVEKIDDKKPEPVKAGQPEPKHDPPPPQGPRPPVPAPDAEPLPPQSVVLPAPDGGMAGTAAAEGQVQAQAAG